MALPVTAMTLTHIAGIFLLARNTMISVIHEPFIKLARAKGLKSAGVKYRHAGRNSMLPVVTRSGLSMSLIMTETLFIELVFAYPGLGYLVYEAANTRDYPVIQGVFLLVAVVVLTVNFLVDLIYPRLDPRVSYAY
jgi:peptide/nickel transport system permease protein